MKIKIFWEEQKRTPLLEKVHKVLEELWLKDFISVETSQDEALQKELNITKEPALIVEEESIDFKDTIFEWIVPEEEELRSMFVSIIWWGNSGWWCAPWGCWSWCSC